MTTDTTLHDRLLAFIAQRERMQHPDIITAANGVELTLSDLKEAAAALAVRGDGWLPIESAPKDGTRVFLWIEWSDVPVVGEFSHKRWWADTEHYEVSCGTYCYGGTVSSDKNMKPTHWMPLPVAPQPQEEVE